LVGVKIDNFTLKDLNLIESGQRLVGDENVLSAKEQVVLEKENLKYVKRQKQWPIEIYGMYEVLKEDYRVGLNINADFFELNYEEKQKKYDIENKNLQLEQEKLSYENRVNERKNSLEYLKNSERNYEVLYGIYLEKYNSVKTLYLAGDLGVLEFLKVQTEMYKNNVEFLKIRNNYYGLVYKISLNIGEDKE